MSKILGKLKRGQGSLVMSQFRKTKPKKKKAKKPRRPFLELHRYYRKRTGSRWKNYKCSECDRELHKSARFCLDCGA